MVYRLRLGKDKTMQGSAIIALIALLIECPVTRKDQLLGGLTDLACKRGIIAPDASIISKTIGGESAELWESVQLWVDPGSAADMSALFLIVDGALQLSRLPFDLPPEAWFEFTDEGVRIANLSEGDRLLIRIADTTGALA